jgi:malate synthase
VFALTLSGVLNSRLSEPKRGGHCPEIAGNTPMSDIEITGPTTPAYESILTPHARTFLSRLCENFAPALTDLLKARLSRQDEWDAGSLPKFLPETASIRASDWTIKGIPEDLQDRRLEITGPVDRKMIINALNSDVKVFMADFEDASTPSWSNLLDGQVNLRDAVNGTISFEDETRGKSYALKEDPAILIARVRGLHLPEKHVLYEGTPIPGALFDFVLYFHHNHKALRAKGSGPYFYIPKLESHLEARWWSEVFAFAENEYGLDIGTIKATILIETLPAVFEMDEILYEMRDHIVALNCGRWDYIFSYIKTLKTHADRVLPTCHRRGAMAMGGMSAFIPSKDPTENEIVRAKVVADKTREANNGHDGTWIAHPGLAEIVQPIFAKALGDQPNQLGVTRGNDAEISAAELLAPCGGACTEAGMRHNIRVGLQYIEAWISGSGCVPIYGLMEDAATAEISRASMWQWRHHGVELETGKVVDEPLIERLIAEECITVRSELGEKRYDSGRFDEATKILAELVLSDQFEPFLTLPAYKTID